mmetsp:Transcript_15112/g.22634  ORF Transcript_15112/g.22634 Transcript_15112/m.22634 type:complete len:519 (+) Transcript_15112:345-1901(+)
MAEARKELSKFSLSEHFHQYGVNMRFLGKVMDCLQEPNARLLVLVEATARLLKTIVFDLWRKKARQLKKPMIAPYYDLTVRFLNKIFSEEPCFDSENFWQNKLEPLLKKRFYIGCSPEASSRRNRWIIPNSAIEVVAIPRSNSFDNSTTLLQLQNGNDGVRRGRSRSTTARGLGQSSNPRSKSPARRPNTARGLVQSSGVHRRDSFQSAADNGFVVHCDDYDQVLDKCKSIRSVLVHLCFSKSEQMARVLLAKRFSRLTKISFNPSLYSKLITIGYQYLRSFDVMDVQELGMKIKHASVITCAQGNFLHMRALDSIRNGTARESLDLFLKARAHFEQALISSPNNFSILFSIARTQYKIIEFVEGGKNMASVAFNMNDPAVQKADRYFQRALAVSHRNSYLLECYATFLDRCQLSLLAEKYFLKSLEANPKNKRCLSRYALFLQEQKDHDAAEKFFERLKLVNREEMEKQEGKQRSKQKSKQRSSTLKRSNKRSSLKQSKRSSKSSDSTKIDLTKSSS